MIETIVRQTDARPMQTGAVAKTIISLAVAVAIGVSLTWLARQGLMIFHAPDKFAYDWRHALLSHRENETRKDIALVLIDDDSLAEYSHQMPVDRGLLASIVRALDAAGVKVIGLDFVFDRPTEKDEQLLDVLKSTNVPIVLGAIDARNGAHARSRSFQNDFFQRAGNPTQGHLLLDRGKRDIGAQDQTVRFVAPTSDAPGHVTKSFAEVLVERSGRTPRAIGEGGHIAWLQPATSAGSLTFTEYIVPEHKVVDAAPDTNLPPSWRDSLKDKIVIVGGAFPDRDRHLIPLSIADGQRVPGAVIHAHIAAQLIDGRSLKPLGLGTELALVTTLAFVGLVAGRWYRLKKYELLIYIVGAIVLTAVGLWLFAEHGIILPSDTVFYSVIISVTVGHYSDWLLNRIPYFASSGAS